MGAMSDRCIDRSNKNFCHRVVLATAYSTLELGVVTRTSRTYSYNVRYSVLRVVLVHAVLVSSLVCVGHAVQARS